MYQVCLRAGLVRARESEFRSSLSPPILSGIYMLDPIEFEVRAILGVSNNAPT